MTPILKSLEALRRPRILIRAARCEADSYNRAPHLRRHLGPGKLPSSSSTILERLMDIEAGFNSERIERATEYSIARHVDLLAAMMGEARIIRASLLQNMREWR